MNSSVKSLLQRPPATINPINKHSKLSTRITARGPVFPGILAMLAHDIPNMPRMHKSPMIAPVLLFSGPME